MKLRASLPVAIAGLAFAILIFLPLSTGDKFLLNTLINVMIFALFGAAWDLSYGVAGLANFGPGVAFGIGAFGLNFFARSGFEPALALLLAAALASASGLLMWIPSIRMSGAYLAIVTLVFLLLASDIALTLTGEDGLTNSILYYSEPIVVSYYGAVAVSMVGIFALLYVSRSRFGLRLRAMKDDEVSAKTVAINTSYHKLVVLVTSSFFLGLAGAFRTLYIGSVNYSIFSITNNFLGITIGVIGGAGSIAGALLGATAVEFPFAYLVTYGSYSLIAYGLTMILVMLFLRGGLVEGLQRVFRRVNPR